MFKCDNCKTMVEPGKKMNKRITHTRPVVYYNYVKESHGHETVHEAQLCEQCAEGFDKGIPLANMARTRRQQATAKRATAKLREKATQPKMLPVAHKPGRNRKGNFRRTASAIVAFVLVSFGATLAQGQCYCPTIQTAPYGHVGASYGVILPMYNTPAAVPRTVVLLPAPIPAYPSHPRTVLAPVPQQAAPSLPVIPLQNLYPPQQQTKGY